MTQLWGSQYKDMKQVIETYTEFPHLKVLDIVESCWGDDRNDANLEVPGAILSRSQLEEFATCVDYHDKDLLKLLAKQTQLKKVKVRSISDV